MEGKAGSALHSEIMEPVLFDSDDLSVETDIECSSVTQVNRKRAGDGNVAVLRNLKHGLTLFIKESVPEINETGGKEI